MNSLTSGVILMLVASLSNCLMPKDDIYAGLRCDFDDDDQTKVSSSTRKNVLEVCNGWTIPVTHNNLTDFVVTSGIECYDNVTSKGGPPNDFSSRTPFGRYAVFMSEVEEETKSAELSSPWFRTPSAQSNISIEFAMNMFGDGDLELRVYLRRPNKPDARLWIAYGDKGTSWVFTRIAVGRLQTDFQFVFRADRGFGDIGHIALDSITIRETDLDGDGDNCETGRFRCETGLCISRGLLCDLENDCADGDDEHHNLCRSTVSPLRCDFEHDLCDFTIVGHSGIIWKRIRGDDFKNGGPAADHTTATGHGYFLQVESNDDKIGLNAVLESPYLPPPPQDHYNDSSPNNNMCQLRFFYYMKGSHVSGLYVHLRERPVGCRDCGSSHKRLLQPIGHSGLGSWLRTSLPLPPLSHRFVIQFEAVKVLPHSGIVAIDDVSMTTECSNEGFDLSDGENLDSDLEKGIRSQPIKEYTNGSLNETVAADMSLLFHTPGVISAVVIVCLCLMAILVCCSFCFITHHRQKRLKVERLLRLSNPECSASTGLTFPNRTPSPPPQPMITEYNPNYDFGTLKGSVHEMETLPRDRLILVRTLGQGAFGEVFQGYLSTCDSVTIPVAAKTLAALGTNQAEMDFLMEALIMSKFKHPNIVRFIGVCFEKHPKLILLELLNGGDVRTFLRESRATHEHASAVTFLDLIQLALDIASGCEYLEMNHFIHRDIAARNCLLTTRGSGRVAKIADFGMARDIYGADYYRKGGKVMLPVKWMPPEAFLDGIFTSKTDVWSFGILLWEIFSFGYVPYPGRGNQEVMTLVTEGSRLEAPNCCPSPVYDLMVICWSADTQKRPSFSAIIGCLRSFLTDSDVVNSQLPIFHANNPNDEAIISKQALDNIPAHTNGHKMQESSGASSSHPSEGIQSTLLTDFETEHSHPGRSDSSWLMLETRS